MKSLSHKARLFGATIGAVVIAIVLSACSDSADVQSELRVLHAVADAPRVNVYVNERLVLEEVDYREGSRYLSVTPGTGDVRVEAIVPGGNLDVIDASDVPFEFGAKATVIAVGNTEAGTIAAWLIEDPVEPVTAGSARVQVHHAADGVGEVNVIVTGPDVLIGDASALDSFSFGETLGPVEVPAGDYRIRVATGTAPFTEDDVVFDSGEVELTAGADLAIAAVLNTTNGSSPVSLVVLDGSGAADLFDVDTVAELRIVHNSPDADPVDVVVDLSDTIAVEALPLTTGLAYGKFEDYQAVPAVDYLVSVIDNHSQTLVFDFEAGLDAGLAYTAIANDVAANIEEWILVDDKRRVFTETKLRLIHGSPSAGVVDIYVNAPDVLPVAASPAIQDVPFGTETGFVSLPPGTYDVYVTPANQPTVLAISAKGLELDGSGIYTAIARDAEDGGGPLGLTLMDDFVP